MFQGFVQLEDTLSVLDLVLNSSRVPANSDSLPTYRVYGPDGPLSGQSGSAAFRHTGSVTDATNANPIVITSAAHGLVDGMRVTVTGVGGNTAANTTAVVSSATTDTFALTGVSGNGSYTSGGTWNAAGLYHASITASAANGYEAGQTYHVLFAGAVSSTSFADVHSFTVT